MKEASIGLAQERATGDSFSGEKDFSFFWRNGLLCALLVGVSLLATYPVAEIGFIDDWSYIKTALDFSRTGHLLYNGWGAPIQGWQVVWGALFIKLFGFSFTIVRLSMLPIAMASVYLFHQILVRFGVSSRLAVFGTLTLGLSPLFTPLAASFMTDVPGLFVILLCLLMCQRALAARTDRAALLWLISAALLNMAGGTVRQIAWLGVLVIVPSTAWLCRKRRGMALTAIVLWLASLFFILACQHWFNQQPYTVSENALTLTHITASLVLHFPVEALKVLLCQLLVLLPVLIAWLPGTSKLSRQARIGIAAVMIVLAGCALFIEIGGPLIGHGGPREDEMMPWLAGHLALQGLAHTHSYEMLGLAPMTLGVGARLAISWIVVLAGLSFAEQMREKKKQREPSRESMQCAWREIVWLLGPFSAGYLFLLLPRGLHGFVFDRYLLPLTVVLIVALLKLYQQEGRLKPAAISWTILVIFAAYSLAATHDWFAMARARVFAANEVISSGVPRTAIQGGFEYDAWTQIENDRYINEAFIGVPKGAYHPTVLQPLPPGCRYWLSRYRRFESQYWFSDYTPSVKPDYFLAFERIPCLASSKYPAVFYRRWFPPFGQKVYIMQLPEKSQ